MSSPYTLWEGTRDKIKFKFIVDLPCTDKATGLYIFISVMIIFSSSHFLITRRICGIIIEKKNAGRTKEPAYQVSAFTIV